jgi:hypothetical protein
MGAEALGFIPNPVGSENPYNYVKLVLPGVVSYESAAYRCAKRPNDTVHEECVPHKISGDALRWRHDQLKRWRQELNLPGRLSDLRAYAMRLNLYGDQDEAERLRRANTLIQVRCVYFSSRRTFLSSLLTPPNYLGTHFLMTTNTAASCKLRRDICRRAADDAGNG